MAIIKNIPDITRTKTSIDGGDTFFGRNASGDLQTDLFSAADVTNNYCNNLIIDGDFNHWNDGTSFTADGYTADMWHFDFKSATGSVTQQDMIDSDVTKKFMRINTTVSDINLVLSQRLKGADTLNGKNLSIFARMKSSTGIKFRPRIGYYDGSGDNTTSFNTMTIEDDDVWRWYSWNVTVPAIDTTLTAGNYSYIRFQTREDANFTLDFDKIRVIETPDILPEDTVPAWVQIDENDELTKPMVKQYLTYQTGGSGIDGPVAFGIGIGVSQTGHFVIPTEAPMIQTPTITFQGAGGPTLNKTSAVAVTNPAIINVTISQEAVMDRYVEFTYNDNMTGFSLDEPFIISCLNVRGFLIDARY